MSAPYVCRYCRQASDPAALACPNCGAPLDVRALTSRSGWEEQPAIKDMARIQFGHSHLQVSGFQVPVADFGLAGEEWIYFSHHVLLWADASVQLSNAPFANGWNRMLAGLPLIMVEARGPGHIALSENHAGDVIALPLQAGQQMWVREHRFLAATGNVSYSWQQSDVWFVTGSGNDRKFHYPLGRFGDTFTAQNGPGLTLLHAPGDTFIRDLQSGETVLTQPSALLYRDLSVTAHLHLEYPHSQGMGWLGSRYQMRNVWLRLVGPGRVAIQSVFERPEGAEVITGGSYATTMAW